MTDLRAKLDELQNSRKRPTVSEWNRKNKVKHGEVVGGKRSSEYTAWVSMIQRCDNPFSQYFDRYGGRGISVCKRWRSFKLFLKDMGRRPSQKHSLDRINNDRGYKPSNCRWATWKQQANNRTKKSKLNWKMVRDIRKRFKTGGYTQRELGEMFKVAQNSISLIVNNHSWIEHDIR